MHNFTAEWRLLPSDIPRTAASRKEARVYGKNRTAALSAATALFSACRDLLQAAAASLPCIQWLVDLVAHRSSHRLPWPPQVGQELSRCRSRRRRWVTAPTVQLQRITKISFSSFFHKNLLH